MVFPRRKQQMPYSGCIDKKQIFFYPDAQGSFKKIDKICNNNTHSSSKKFSLCSPNSKNLRIPCSHAVLNYKNCPLGNSSKECKKCIDRYNTCIRSGEKICENPNLYCDMFCNEICIQSDEKKAASCFTECKLACLDENECPYYMANHCHTSSPCEQIVFEGFEMTTSTPQEDLNFPEPPTFIPYDSQEHRQLEYPSPTPAPIVQVASSIENVLETSSPLPPPHFQDPEKPQSYLWVKVMLICAIIFIAFIDLTLFIYLIQWDKPSPSLSSSSLPVPLRQTSQKISYLSSTHPVRVFRPNPFLR